MSPIAARRSASAYEKAEGADGGGCSLARNSRDRAIDRRARLLERDEGDPGESARRRLNARAEVRSLANEARSAVSARA